MESSLVISRGPRATVSVSMGAMDSLVEKLITLKANPTLEHARQPMEKLLDKLGSLFSMMLVLMGEEPALQAKQWMKQVREMVYDIEDWVDDCLNHRENREKHEAEKRGGVIKLAVKKLRPTDVLSKKIKSFITRVDGANDRYRRYKLYPTYSPADNIRATPGSSSIDLHNWALHAETGLIGIDIPTKEILDRLSHSELKLNVVSLVGSGGLGKTTLAKQVYTKLQEQFKCGAFVHAGRNPSVKTILMGMLTQFNCSRPDATESWHEQQLIDNLKEYLKHQKYLVVIDDVWTSTILQIIKCALPENDLGSRIMITTRIRDVAISSCINQVDHVYDVKALALDNAKKLFLGRTFGPQEKCPTELGAICDSMLKQCGGVPLAITIIAGLLAHRKPTEQQWESANSYISSEGDKEGIEKILLCSYMSLPQHLRPCFLYLCVFPEGYTVRKGRLIRRWIAERFISGEGEESIQEVGEKCFDELVCRSLIQIVSTDDDEETGCMIHDVVRDFIIRLSAEENFVTVPVRWINLMPHDKIRRLSLQHNNQGAAPKTPSGMITSHVRSLTIFGSAVITLPDLSRFRYLRVLDLQVSGRKKYFHLEGIEELFHLRYLGLDGEAIDSLPGGLGKLKYMETLDVRGTNVTEVPAGTLPSNLAHLLVRDVELPHEVNKMRHLHELSMVNIGKRAPVKSIADLENLKDLRIFGVKLCFDDVDKEIESSSGADFVCTLNKVITWLKSLCIDTGTRSSFDFLESLSLPPHNPIPLREFKLISLHYYFPELPKNMANLTNLTYLEVGIAQVGEAELQVIGGLPALILLKLRSAASADKEKCIISKNGFERLQEFWFMRRDGGITGLEFQEKAMANVRKLRLQFSARQAQTLHAALPAEVHHLSSIKQVHVVIDCEGAKPSEVDAAQAAINKSVGSDPAFQFRLRTLHVDKMMRDETSVAEITTEEPYLAGYYLGFEEGGSENEDTRVHAITDDDEVEAISNG